MKRSKTYPGSINLGNYQSYEDYMCCNNLSEVLFNVMCSRYIPSVNRNILNQIQLFKELQKITKM